MRSQFNDQQTIKRLYPEGRNFMRAKMRPADRVFTRFCQWCAGVRERVPGRDGLVCIQCDRREIA